MRAKTFVATVRIPYRYPNPTIFAQDMPTSENAGIFGL
jgi:hypothetical protein